MCTRICSFQNSANVSTTFWCLFNGTTVGIFTSSALTGVSPRNARMSGRSGFGLLCLRLLMLLRLMITLLRLRMFLLGRLVHVLVPALAVGCC